MPYEDDRDLDFELNEANAAIEEFFLRPPAEPCDEWTDAEIESMLPAPF